ncbi:exported hypothetical protein [Mesorhizobium plurifarium]|uniref:Uncharacterized protein n=1 Tax=Mesorhizobium plurifarium TaxID=69974 RepID=A0A090FV93_MESPL|nr:exported hypothetical protein [Mesorhizobium plurifarium]
MFWTIVATLIVVSIVGHILQARADMRSEMRFGPRSENRWIIENERINVARHARKESRRSPTPCEPSRPK